MPWRPRGGAGGGGAGGGSSGGGGSGSGGGGGSAARYDHKRTVFVGNLPYGATEEALRGAMGGEAVEAVRIVRDRATQAGKGIGYVLFRERAAVLGALALHGVACAALGGRALRVERCEAAAQGAPPRAASAGGGAGAASAAAPAPVPAPAPAAPRAAPLQPAAKRPRHTHKARQPSHMGGKGLDSVGQARKPLPQRKGLVAGSHSLRRGRTADGKKVRAKGGRNGAEGKGRPRK